MLYDSHIKRIRQNDFNKELGFGKYFFRSFNGANAKQLRHYIIPTLIDSEANTIVIPVDTNAVFYSADFPHRYSWIEFLKLNL